MFVDVNVIPVIVISSECADQRKKGKQTNKKKTSDSKAVDIGSYDICMVPRHQSPLAI